MPKKKNKFDEWFDSLPRPLRNLIEKMTVTDWFNVACFSGTAFLTFRGIDRMNNLQLPDLPDWFEWLTQYDPIYAFLKKNGMLPGQFRLDLVDQIIVSLLAGYASIKLVPLLLPNPELAQQFMTSM